MASRNCSAVASAASAFVASTTSSAERPASSFAIPSTPTRRRPQRPALHPASRSRRRSRLPAASLREQCRTLRCRRRAPPSRRGLQDRAGEAARRRGRSSACARRRAERRPALRELVARSRRHHQRVDQPLVTLCYMAWFGAAGHAPEHTVGRPFDRAAAHERAHGDAASSAAHERLSVGRNSEDRLDRDVRVTRCDHQRVGGGQRVEHARRGCAGSALEADLIHLVSVAACDEPLLERECARRCGRSCADRRRSPEATASRGRPRGRARR